MSRNPRQVTVILPHPIGTAEGGETSKLLIQEPLGPQLRQLEARGNIYTDRPLTLILDIVEICCVEPPLTRGNVDEMGLSAIDAVSKVIHPFGLLGQGSPIGE